MTDSEFKEVYQRLRPKLLAIAARIGGVERACEEAEDMVSESLITLWRLAKGGYPIRNAEALAVRITKNVCIDRVRRRRQVPHEPLPQDRQGEATTEEATDEADAKVLRLRCYSLLTDTERTYLRLRSEFGMSLDEIAEETGRPKTSVKTTISTARRKLMDELKKEIQ